MRTRSLIASWFAAALALSTAGSALAGVSYAGSYGYVTQYGGSFVAGSSSSSDYSLTPSSFTANLRGDFSYVLPYATTQPGRWQLHSFTLFTVGLIPVKVADTFFDMNYKLVLGNGDSSAPYASCYAEFNMYQALDPFNPNPAVDPVLMGRGENRWQYGNGYNVVDESFTWGLLNPVLGAGLTYYLAINVDAGISTFHGYNGYTQLSTTLEFGGPATNGTYDGFDLGFYYVEVPAPGAGVLAGLAGLVAIRRRR